MLAAALAVGAVVLAIAGWLRRARPSPLLAAPELSCVSGHARVETRGRSLGALVPAGTALTLLQGYYRCNDVQRGDLVALRFGGDVRPLAKVVRGLPGDRLALSFTPSGERLLINGEPAHNSRGQPYLLDAAADRMLGTYVRGFGGVIPADAYLVLGDEATKTTDSRVFGLVARTDLLGLLLPATGGNATRAP